MYYDQAIEIARSTDNLLVLGSSLEEKGRVLLADGQLEALRAVESEAIAVAEDINNPDLLVGARLLHARALAAYDPHNLETALAEVDRVLTTEDLDEEQVANAYLTRYRISGGLDDEARQKALDLFEGLYRATPKFIYNYNLSMLRGERAL